MKVPMSQVDAIIKYEQGDLSEDETLELFGGLVRSGLAWQLQGHYGRTAVEYIRAGLIETVPCWTRGEV